ncbi:MAG: hypothetical protein WAW53_00860 [Candidatus Dormiibacterota bacterium]
MALSSVCTRALIGAGCMATVLLTACGSPAPTVTPSSAASAAASPTAEATPFAGSGFRTDIPEGWQDETTSQSAASAGGGTVLMVLGAPDHGVVVARTVPQPVADDQLGQYLATIIPAGSTGISQAEPVDIAGVSGVMMTFTYGSPGAAPRENQDMVVNQAGNTYEIALTTLPSDFPADSAGLQEILNSWTWA